LANVRDDKPRYSSSGFHRGNFHQDLPDRRAELERRFAELGPEILRALNSELGRLSDDPKYASIGSFDEAGILEGGDFSVFILSVNSRSLFQNSYIGGNVSDQLLVNPGETKLGVRIYQQSFENEDFKHPCPLVVQGEVELAPGGSFFAAEDATIVVPVGGRSDAVLLALRLRPRVPYNWMYDVNELRPKYAVCVDPTITQILFILNTFSRTGLRLPADLEQRVSVHHDFSVRWAFAEYLLRKEPHRALGWLCELAERDADLGDRAKHCISVLQDRRELDKWRS
jgi:hypothetical protein